FCARLDKLRLTHALRRKNPVHDLLQVPREDQIFYVGSQNSYAIGRGGFLNVAKDFIAEAITVREDVLKSHGGQRTARGQLHIAVKPLLKTHHRVKCCSRVSNAELHYDADADGHFVGGKDFLTLDGEFALADVDEDDFDSRTAVEAKVQV